LSPHEETIDAGFFAKRFAAARTFRERLYPEQTTYRWVYGESDELPGLIVDRYGSMAAVQTGCPFYGMHSEAIANGLLETEGVDGVAFQVGDEGIAFGTLPERVECEIEGMTLGFSLEESQKTGLFLDQRDNWPQIAPFAKQARVFDGHCYVGAWSIYAARHGAKEVIGVDSSESALEAARENASRNGITNTCSFVRGDVQETLASSGQFDVVLIDPPALAKKRSQTNKALGLYRALNRDAMKAVVPGGILVTSSCSHHVDREEFLETLKRTSASAQRRVQLLGLYGASKDHPVLLSMPETAYLKCAVLRVL
jgi:23S rRNA (cytosine1962-C5)-methyltransferase